MSGPHSKLLIILIVENAIKMKQIIGNHLLITYDGHFRHLAQTVIYGSI